MPELPEVRALSEHLDVELSGTSLTRVDIHSFSGLKTVDPAPADLLQASLTRVASRGKYLIFAFGATGRALIHLGNSGRVDVERPVKATRPRGSLLRFVFADAGLLVREHGTERRAGLWVLADGDEGPLASLGPEPLEDEFREFVLSGSDSRWLHTTLRDQHTVAGIGRGYADDLLHRARVSPFTSLSRLDAAARLRLYEATVVTVTEALESERRRTGGLSASSLGDRFRVHRRFGTPCPACGRALERVSFESHEVVYCPDCQTKGKLLADRRMSHYLR